MKQVMRCLGCEKVKRVHRSFKVKIVERTKSILTGEIKEVEMVGRVCRDCAAKAGYKVKAEVG